jgi:glutathione synthase
VYVTYVDKLTIKDNRVIAYTNRLNSISYSDDNWFSLSEQAIHNLTDFLWVKMRKDPPFDETYLNATYILDIAKNQGAKIFNNPTALRKLNEKINAFNYSKFTPKTILTKNKEEILFFIKTHKKAVIKPINGMGGDGIFQLIKNDKNINSILESATNNWKDFVIVQKLIPKYTQGDKRVLLVGGDVIEYGLLRIPSEGESRANLAKGGCYEISKLTNKEKEISIKIAGDLLKEGVVFAGLDFINNYLTEINITSPTCVKQIEENSEIKIAKKLIDFFNK